MRLRMMVAAVLLAGCEERVRECEGGVEVVIELDDASVLDRAAEDMVVTVEAGGVTASRTFETAHLAAGSTAFVLDLDAPGDVDLVVTVDVAYDGPGNGVATSLLHGEGEVVVPGGDSGCGRLVVPLVAADDGDDDGVPDAADVCPSVADDQANSDTDALGDACDACPLADNGQHDEDGDGLGDGCDPCPHLAGDATDGDQDGVGDACDPHPDDDRDAIALFLAFDDQADLDALTLVGTGEARIEDGALYLQSATARMAYASVAIGTDGEVVTRSRRIDHDAVQNVWGEGIVGWVDPGLGEPNGMICMAWQRAAALVEWPLFSTGMDPPAEGTIGDVNDVRMNTALEGIVGSSSSVINCLIEDVTEGMTREPPGDGQFPGFGVFVEASSVRFDFLFVVDS